MAESPRSLADDLRSRSDESLAELLRRRPDLTTPLPSDLGQLAARSHTAGSTTRALDRLDAFVLQVLDVLVVLPEPVAADEVSPWLPGADPRQVSDAVDDLWLLGLAWGDRNGLRPTTTVREALGPTPAGLGPWRSDLVSAAPRPTPDELDGLLAAAPDGALAALERMVWGPPQGTVERADRVVSATEAATPVDWLLATGLLVATNARTVVLPRDVDLRIRGHRETRLAHQQHALGADRPISEQLGDRVGEPQVAVVIVLPPSLSAPPVGCVDEVETESGGVGVAGEPVSIVVLEAMFAPHRA